MQASQNAASARDKSDRGEAEIVIRPLETSLTADLAETWRYRRLLGAMSLRQFREEYAGSWLGWLWVLARPLTMLAVFTVFKRLADAQVGENMPYPLYLYSGLILWFFFIASVELAAGSLERDAGLIRKVYFPRLVSPLAAVGGELLALAVTAAPLIPIMIWFGVHPGWWMLALPALVVQMMLLIVGVGALFSVLSLQGGDWRRGLTLVLYIGLFLSPVIYAPEMIPENARAIYHLNPMVGSLLAFRAMLVDGVAFPIEAWAYSWAVSVAAFIVGMLAFHRFERDMLDRL